ncbi:MAG: Gfo/Idh/MocA family oxidoreductase [Bacteroidales bacterium]|nr:Gfo/Idh/MocA family oxidoreductase [Bacteroidales bacterium]
MSDNNMSRRSFLRDSALVTAAAMVAPSVICSGKNKKSEAKSNNRRILGAGDKVNLALIGIGNRGAEDAEGIYATGLCNIVALCDVDMGAPHTRKVMAMFPSAPTFQDWRKMFDKMADEIDAVLVATPDHSHFAITMAAMKLGKHVYVEKPLARTFRECELLMEAEKKYGVVTQMGNQGHSEGNYFQFKTWVEEGIIKDVTRITAHMNNSRRWHGWNPAITSYPAAESIPETMDWDTWLGAAYPRDYNHDFHNGQWRCWYQYGMGALGDWGAHILDTSHEFLKLGLPTEVNPLYLKDRNPFFYPMSSTLLFKFPEREGMPAVDVTWYDGLDNIPEIPAGYGVSEVDPNIPLVAGQAFKPSKLNPGKEIYSKTLTFKGGSHGSTLSIIPEDVAREMAGKLPEVPRTPSNHYLNFLRACLGIEKPRSPFSVSGPLSQVFCLGVIAQWTGEKVIFDRETKQITNNPILNQLLWGPTPREGWEEYFKL